MRQCWQGNFAQVYSCAMQALTAVIERSKETTMMGIERELKDAAASLER